jgi:hypothetical protein
MEKEYKAPCIIIQLITEDVVTASWDSWEREEDETEIMWAGGGF